MTQNALQREFIKKIEELRSRIGIYDKGVLLGFTLSLVPIFPVAAFGLLIGVLNRALHKAGKLSGYDYELVRKGLLVGALNTFIGIVIIIWVVNLFQSLDPATTVQLFFGRLKEFWLGLLTLPSVRPGVRI
jgi:hypothetical protein